MLSPQPTQPSDNDASPPMSPVSTTTSSSTFLDAKPVATRTRSNKPALSVLPVDKITKELSTLRIQKKVCVICAKKDYNTYCYNEKTGICWKCYGHIKSVAMQTRKIVTCESPCGENVAKSCNDCLSARAKKLKIELAFFNKAPLQMDAVQEADLTVGSLIQCTLYTKDKVEPEMVKILLTDEQDVVFYGRIDQGHRGTKRVVVKKAKLANHRNLVAKSHDRVRHDFVGQYPYKNNGAILVVPFEGHDLKEIIYEKGCPSMTSALRILICVLKDLNTLYSLDISHGDIFTRNICLKGPVNTAKQVCLIDFGEGYMLKEVDESKSKKLKGKQLKNMMLEILPKGHQSVVLDMMEEYLNNNGSTDFDNKMAINAPNKELQSHKGQAQSKRPLFPPEKK